MRPSPDPITVVLVLDHAFVTGGQAKVAIDSAKGLKKRGHEPIVFAAVGPVDAGLVQSDIRTVCLGQADLLGNASRLAAAAQGLWNVSAAQALGDLLDGLPRDRTVVHVHGWAKALSPSIAGPIRRSRFPAVYTMHEYFLMCPNGGFFNYKRQHACGLDPMSAACWLTDCDSRSYGRKLWRNARQLVAENVARLPDVFSDIICISNFQVDVVGHRLPRGARVHLIANPIATVPLGHKPEPGSGPVAFVGRISPEKGPFLFAEAARKVGMASVFVGEGPVVDDLRRRYPEARILGWQNAEDVRNTLRGAGALVFPSLWYEGQPLTVLEAKSLGTPVIVSDGCAGREEIVDGLNGLWFRSGDADDLARALEAFRQGDIGAMSRSAYDTFWADPPTLERHVDAITAVYAAVLGQAPAARAAA